MMTDTALAATVAAKVTTELDANKESIVASVAGMAKRLAIRAAWSTLVGLVLMLLVLALKYAREEFGKWSVSDLIDFIERHVRPGFAAEAHR